MDRTRRMDPNCEWSTDRPKARHAPLHPAEPQLTSPIGPDGVDTGMLGEIAVRLFGKN